jgi:magnesium transporter
MIVDSAIYVDGRRSAPRSLEGTHDACHDRGGFAWIGLYKPTEEEFASVTGEFELHPLAVEDAVKAHQRPKVEHYGDAIFVVLKSARYLEDSRRVKFGEIHAFLGADFLVTVRYGEASALGDVRRSMENEPALLRLGPAAILYAIMDQVVDDYTPVAEGLENDIDEIETEVFGGNPRVSRRIYEVSREVLQFHRATQPLAEALEHLLRLEAYGLDGELRKHLRDVRDHTLRIGAGAELSRAALEHPQRESDAGEREPERRGQESLGLGGHPGGPDDYYGHLRDELRTHARAGVEVWLSVCADADGGALGPTLRRLQTFWLVMIMASRGVARGTPPRCGCEHVLGSHRQPRALVARVRKESL